MPGTKVGAAYYDLDLDDKKFEKGMSGASKSFNKLGDMFENAEKGSYALLGAITAVGVGVVAFGVSSVQAFQESQDAIAATNAVLKSTGGIAGVTGVMVNDLAEGLQKVTTFSDETIRSGENLLLTFTNISKDVFPDAVKIMLDMSQALGQDLKGSAIQLGKALQDPILGVSALRRVGVNFNEKQQEVIKTLVESGKVMEAQKLILKELQTEFGGAAEAAGSTFTGKITQLNNKLNDLQEEVGAVIVYYVTPLLDKFSEWVDSLGGIEDVIYNVDKALREHSELIYAIGGAISLGLLPAIVDLVSTFADLVLGVSPFLLAGAALGLIIKALADQAGGLGPFIEQVRAGLQNVWDTIAPTLIPALQQLWSIIQTKVWPALQLIWQTLVDNLVPIFKTLWEQITTQLWPALQALWAELEPKLLPVLKLLGVLLGGLVLGAIITIAYALVGLVDVITAVVKAFTDWLDNLEWRFNQAKAQWDELKKQFEAGVQIIKDAINEIPWAFQQLVKGIEDALSGVWNAITRPFKEAFDWLGDRLGEARENLDKLNPFHRESPSIVDWISKGTDEIKSLYGNMFTDLDNMALNNRVNMVTGAQLQTGQTSKQSNSEAIAPVSININMSGVMARSRGELRDIGEELIGAINDGLRAKGKPQIAV